MVSEAPQKTVAGPSAIELIPWLWLASTVKPDPSTLTRITAESEDQYTAEPSVASPPLT